MNESFTWEDLVPYVCGRINSALIFLLQQCRRFIHIKSAFALFYYQFIYYHLINGIHLYANLISSRCTNKIFLLQKRAFRIIANVQNIPQAPDIHWLIIKVSVSVVFRQSAEIVFWHC